MSDDWADRLVFRVLPAFLALLVGALVFVVVRELTAGDPPCEPGTIVAHSEKSGSRMVGKVPVFYHDYYVWVRPDADGEPRSHEVGQDDWLYLENGSRWECAQ